VANAAQHEFSSFNWKDGRAAVEYKSRDVHIVVAYYHSQRHHDSRWLLIEAALSTTKLMVIPRTAFSIRNPAGRVIPLATQRRFARDMPAVRPLLQSASVTRYGLRSYFNQGQTDAMTFFALPFGGIVHDDFVVDVHRVVLGDLFFESPTGLWESGTHALIVGHQNGIAELPIELD
jgi:hypothetical protein